MEAHQNIEAVHHINDDVASNEVQSTQGTLAVSTHVSVTGISIANDNHSTSVEGAPHLLYATEHVVPVDEAYCGPKTYAVAGLLSVFCLLPCAACLPFCPCDTRRINKRRYLIR